MKPPTDTSLLKDTSPVEYSELTVPIDVILGCAGVINVPCMVTPCISLNL